MTFKYKGTRYNVQDNPYRIETIINENYEKAERGREKNGEIERERGRRERWKQIVLMRPVKDPGKANS